MNEQIRQTNPSTLQLNSLKQLTRKQNVSKFQNVYLKFHDVERKLYHLENRAPGSYSEPIYSHFGNHCIISLIMQPLSPQ